MSLIKIFKFRKLLENEDRNHLIEIIETGYFWCSRFWEFNDPLEGVFNIECMPNLKDITDALYSEKGKFMICCFSRKIGFRNPIMWGHYSGGFKGVAIEIAIKRNEVEKVNYNIDISSFEGSDIKKLLYSKTKPWKHENEYRYLEKTDKNLIRIGKIKAIYFGSPYEGLESTEQITEGNTIFENYNDLKNQIIKIAEANKVPCYNVKIFNNRVIRGEIIKVGHG
jgi:hypothetical protein